MPVNSRVDMIEALAAGDFDRLVDTPESVWFDFKAAAPDLKSAKGLRDFLADVASFANAQGGLLLFGAKGKRDESTREEMVAEVSGVGEVEVDLDQITKLVRAHVRPLLHVEVRRYSRGDCTAVLVNVEAQADAPFLVDTVGTEGEHRTVPHGFGWPVRHGDGTHWESLDRVQQLLSIGLRLSASLNSTNPEVAALADEAEAQLELLSAVDEFDDWAYYSVQAVPMSAGTRIRDFYGEFVESARAWRGVRTNGFDLGFDYSPLAPAGKQRLIATSWRRAVVVGRSGVTTMSALGSPEWLGWSNHQGMPRENMSFVEINPFVIVEHTTEFVRFVSEFVAPRLETPSGWTLTARGHFLTGDDVRKPLHLRERPRRALSGFFNDPKEPLDDSFEVAVEATGDALSDSVRLLGEVYGDGWGSSPEAVPFVTDGRIDWSQIAGT